MQYFYAQARDANGIQVYPCNSTSAGSYSNMWISMDIIFSPTATEAHAHAIMDPLFDAST